MNPFEFWLWASLALTCAGVLALMVPVISDERAMRVAEIGTASLLAWLATAWAILAIAMALA